LRRVSPEVRIDTEQIKDVLVSEVIKREVTEGEKAEDAKRKLSRAAGKSLKGAAKDNGKPDQEVESKPATPTAHAPPAGV
jgi:hypothetical protein